MEAPAAVALHDRAHLDAALAQDSLDAPEGIVGVHDLLGSHGEGEHLFRTSHLDSRRRLNYVRMDAVGTVEPSALRRLVPRAIDHPQDRL
ncbi:MAG: hypothetical protein ACYC1Z_06990 [Georgenia sp.]